MKLKFERNDIPVVGEEAEFPTLKRPQVILSVVGFRINGGCIGYASFRSRYYALQLIGNEGNGVISSTYSFEAGSIYSNGGRLDMQLASFFDGATAEYIASVISDRRSDANQRLLNSVPWLSE